MCDCITQLNEQLKPYNTALGVSINLFSEPHVKAIIETVKLDTKSRKQPMAMIATYCPFCGEKYEATSKQMTQQVANEEAKPE